MDQIGENQPTVFSAHAEVVPIMSASPARWWCILRARGGSSTIAEWEASGNVYSPRTRR